MSQKSEMEKYKKEVIDRLVKSQVNSKKNFAKISKSLTDDGENAAANMLPTPAQQVAQLEPFYKNIIESYCVVIDRLKRYEKPF